SSISGSSQRSTSIEWCWKSNQRQKASNPRSSRPGVLRKNLCSRKLNENGANSRAFLRLSGRRQNRDCSRNCNCQSLQEPQTSTDFNDRHATGSISISYKPQLSTDFNNLWNLVRDQGVGGSNPLSPTNIFNELQPHS